MLINYGTDVYNEWVAHEIPFNDAAGRRGRSSQMEALLLAEGRTNGGRQSIASSNFNTAANPLFDEPPGCFMYRQGNFVAHEGGFPDDVLADLDNTVGVFPMPGLTAEDKPVLGGGDLAGIFSPGQRGRAGAGAVPGLAATSARTGTARAATGSRRAPTSTPASTRTRPCGRSPTIAYESTDFVFDGSDQMPGEVGSGSFWREMAAWISGGQDAAATLDNIENSWPA